MELFGLDSTVLAGLFQSLAAVLAVLFGWGLSALTERRSWRRRKTEQIRERQLTLLSQIVVDLRTAISVTRDAASAVDEFMETRRGSEDEKARALLDKEAHARLQELRSGLIPLVAQIEAQEMALRLIGFRQEGLSAIAQVLVPLKAIAGDAGPRRREEVLGLPEFKARLEEFRTSVSGFLNTGSRGLSV